MRVLETLAACDLVACEDTRVTAKLLQRYGITAKTISYHEHNADSVGPKLIRELKAGKSVVQVSDAGTPLVSDPGLRLANLARDADVSVWPLPGPTAPVAALVASGLSCETWTFAGFLPTKQGARKSRLETLSAIPFTLIFFESPNRLGKALSDMAEVMGSGRNACVARELTKLHEEVYRGTLGELAVQFGNSTPKGEIVVLVEPPSANFTHDVEHLLLELMEEFSLSKAVAEASSLTGLSKRDLYQKALSLKENDG